MKNLLLIVAFLLSLTYVLFSFFVGRHVLDGFDLSATIFLQNNISHVFDTPLSVFSLIGSFEISSFILLIIVAKLVPPKRRLIVIFFYFLILGIEFLGKTLIFHPNPPPKFFRYDIPFFFPSTHVSTSYSYPSGHAARTAFISLLVILSAVKDPVRTTNNLKNKIIMVLILLFDLLMFISRPYLGEHWTTDVLGGVILGVSMWTLSLSVRPASTSTQKPHDRS